MLTRAPEERFGVCRIYNYSLTPNCKPPFNATPDCYTGIGEYMITSRECALSYSRLFNISDASPLLSISAAVNEIQSMCDAITTEVLPDPQCSMLLPAQ